jgi:rod shape-determining protein MreC
VVRLNRKNLTYTVLAILFLLTTSFLIPPLRSPALVVLKYPLNLFTLIKKEIGGIIFYHRNLLENEILRKENDSLKRRIIFDNEVYLENSRLRELVNFKKRTSYKVISATVIGRSLESWSSIVILGKGRHNGIRKGMVAINYLGLAGRVVEADAFTSKIMLVSDPNLSVSAIIQRSRQEGLVSGTLGGSLVMRYLPKDADVQKGDIIITSGLTSNYPKGLVIGIVTDKGEEFSGLSVYAIIKPAVDLNSIEELLLIIPDNK